MHLRTGYAEINAVLRDNASGTIEFDMRPAEWRRRVRSLVSSAFMLVEELAALGEGGAPVDFMEQFAFRLPVNVICELLGNLLSLLVAGFGTTTNLLGNGLCCSAPRTGIRPSAGTASCCVATRPCRSGCGRGEYRPADLVAQPLIIQNQFANRTLAAAMAWPPAERDWVMVTSPRDQARRCSIAWRGRGSNGCTDSKRRSTCSAHAAAHRAKSRWSLSVSVPPRRMVMNRWSRSLGRITVPP